MTWPRAMIAYAGTHENAVAVMTRSRNEIVLNCLDNYIIVNHDQTKDIVNNLRHMVDQWKTNPEAAFTYTRGRRTVLDEIIQIKCASDAGKVVIRKGNNFITIQRDIVSDFIDATVAVSLITRGMVRTRGNVVETMDGLTRISVGVAGFLKKYL